MKKTLLPTENILSSKQIISLGAIAPKSVGKSKNQILTDERFHEILEEIQEKLDQGLSSAAQTIINSTFQIYAVNNLVKAILHKHLSFALEMKGEYANALSILQEYEDDEGILAQLDDATAISVITQLAIAYNNSGDYPKAVALLNIILEDAKILGNNEILGQIFIALARVYRKLNEFALAKDDAQKGLNYFREVGNWRGMSEAYQLIGASLHQEGNSEKALDYFLQAIKMIGDRPASFMLGKTYSDISGAYWLLHRAKEGIRCLEKSISFFEKTEHKNHATIAYNNLGINLMLLGDWTKAQEAIKRALDLAIETNHVHSAGILDSLGELELLRGNLDEAQAHFEHAITVAEDRKLEWYAIQALRNLARCFLAQGKTGEAISKAQETISRCKKISEKQFANFSRLVLAEAFLKSNNLKASENQLREIEELGEISDLFVLGSIQRLRGLSTLADGEKELAVHHLSRSLTIFETSEDLYHSAVANFELGKSIAETQPERAAKHLNSAINMFGRFGVKPLLDEAQNELNRLTQSAPPAIFKRNESSAHTQLLTMRLAEATTSRELLLRELMAILKQENSLKKIAIIQPNEESSFAAFILDGFTPGETAEISTKIHSANASDELETLGKEYNCSIFALRAPSAAPAFLVMYPPLGKKMADETSIQTLFRVVELGMDVCALREKDRSSRHSQPPAETIADHSLLPGFIHSSPAMRHLVEEVYKIRSSNVTVLVTGESGTGKELVSRAIHTLSSRKDKVFIPFNCTTLPKELAEGQLFGYRKGAFTGAINDSKGVVRSAEGGTLFLDEIGDLPLDVQPKLLRFLQEGEVQTLGEQKPTKVDVRIVAATNTLLEDMVADGRFREDLYYRLNVIRLRVPPLRERRSEIPAMVNYYINHYSERFHRKDITITPQTVDLLMVCDWQGNVRQLCNEMQRVVARAEDGKIITPDDLSPELKRVGTPIPMPNGGQLPSNVTSLSFGANSFNYANGNSIGYSNSNSVAEIAGDITLEVAVSELEQKMIAAAMQKHNGNISRVSRELGLTRRGLYLKLERYKMSA